jgi:hypothetical protein
MRFGHSMVRDAYVLSSRTDIELPQMLRVAMKTGPLDPKWEIDWGRFFQGASPHGASTTAQPIDTFISKGMYEIPIGVLRLFNFGIGGGVPYPLPNIRLPLLSLVRGVAMCLPIGQDVANAFGETILSDDELMHDRAQTLTAQGEVLRDHRLLQSTPLWYYILKESELRENGSFLGATGSHIVAETIHAALRYDRDSYLNHPGATPMPPVWQIGSEKRQLLSLGALFEVAPRLDNPAAG